MYKAISADVLHEADVLEKAGMSLCVESWTRMEELNKQNTNIVMLKEYN